MLEKLGTEAAGVVAAAVHYRTNPVSVMRRYWHLYRDRLFSPSEIRFFQLLDPSLADGDLAKIISKEELVRLQDRLNPREARAVTEDKLRFHDRCVQQRLPVPAIHGRCPPLDASGIEAMLRGVDDDALIVKPVDGVNGEGVMRIRRVNGAWLDDSDARFDADRFLELVRASGYGRWLFQQRVRGHADLCALSATEGLQTVRVVTALERDGNVRILATRLRLICGDLPYDNFNYGTTGNVIANVDVERGEIVTVVRNENGRLRYVERHPRTDRALLGYRPPVWDEVKQLAVDAARSFAPLVTVGWDIGIASPHPVLIEGNATWGILSGEPKMGEIYRYLRTL